MTMNNSLLIGGLRIFIKKMTDEQFQKRKILHMKVENL